MEDIRVLIVEDEGIVATDIQERLSAMGYRPVGWADDAERAIAMAEAQRPDIVLMDIRLPGPRDGIHAAEEIARRFQIPVVFLTAYSEEATLERAKLAQPFGYILKPFNDRELKSTLEIAFYKHRTEREIRRLNRLLDVLGQVNQATLRLQSREELLPAICSLIVERGAVVRAWISWLDQETSQITTAAYLENPSANVDASHLCADGGSNYTDISARAIREGKPVVCKATSSRIGQAGEIMEDSPFRHSCAAFPLKFQGQVRGALGLCVIESDFFRKRELSLLKEMTSDISYALDRIDADMARERLTEQLKHQSLFLRTLIDAMPYPVFYQDLQYQYLGCNKALERFLGIRREDFIGRTVHEVWPPDLAVKYHQSDRELLENPESRAQILPGVVETSGGVRHDVLFHKAVFRNANGSIGGIITIVEDLTERNRAEQERARVEAQLRQSEVKAPLPRGRERILIVEDEPELAIVAQKMLENLGYEAHSQRSGIEALEIFRLHLPEKPFDLVLTDLTMPHLTGLDLTRKLLNLQPDLPIVLFTGFKEKITEEEAKRLGVQRLLLKPFTIQALAVTIRQVLDENMPHTRSRDHPEIRS